MRVREKGSRQRGGEGNGREKERVGGGGKGTLFFRFKNLKRVWEIWSTFRNI